MDYALHGGFDYSQREAGSGKVQGHNLIFRHHSEGVGARDFSSSSQLSTTCARTGAEDSTRRTITKRCPSRVTL